MPRWPEKPEINLSRNIALACGHPEGSATLHRDERTAWCPSCEADVSVTHLPDGASGATRPGPWQLTHHMTIEMGNLCGKPQTRNERASSDWAQVDCTDCLALKSPNSWRPALVFELMELDRAGALVGIRAVVAERLRQVRGEAIMPDEADMPYAAFDLVKGQVRLSMAERDAHLTAFAAALLAAEIDRQGTGRGDGNGQ